jgi:hypothetical protein
VHGEDFPAVFLPRLYGELVKRDVEELYASIARCCEDLVFMRLRPCRVVESILRVEPGSCQRPVGSSKRAEAAITISQ